MSLHDFTVGFVAATILATIAVGTPFVKNNIENNYWLELISKENIRVKGEDNFTAEVKIGVGDRKIIFVRKEVKKVPY